MSSSLPSPPKTGRLVGASLFMVGLRIAFRLIGLISSLVLVRLLAPQDFGIVGLATAVASSLELLTETSFALALIRLPDMAREHLDTAWTFQIMRGLLIGALVAASSGFAASWMDEPRVMPIMWVLAATSLIQGFENIGTVEFRRNLQFGKVFQARLISKLVGLAVTLPLAVIFRSYWALVLGTVVVRVFLVGFSYYQHPYRPRLSLAKSGELLHFSKWLVISNALWVIEGSLATVLFGRIGGSRAVGLFQVSYQIAALPASEIAAPIREPMYSAYARFLTDTPKLRRQFVDGLAVLLVVIAPMSIGIALTADLLTPVALGPQWSDATDLIRLCAIYALLDAVAHYPFNLFIVLNRQRGLVLTFAAVLCVRFVLFVWAGGTWGMNAGLTVLVGTSALGAIVWMGSAARLIKLSVRELLRPVWRTVGATATMAVVLLAFMDLHAGTASLAANLLKLLSVAACGAAVQIATQALLWTLCGMPDGPESYLLGFVRNAVRRFARFRLGPATG